MSKVRDALARNHPEGGGGVRCPYCGSTVSRVVDTNKRLTDATRRKRVCVDCNHSFYTSEQVSGPKG